jgi:hypothetical protein
LSFDEIHFLHYKIIGAPERFLNQPRPLFKPSYVNFCQISHETVTLRHKKKTWCSDCESLCSVLSSEVQLIEGEGGKSLADLVALNIGQMGENMALGHIDFFASPPGEQCRLCISVLWIRILRFLNYNWRPRSGSVILNYGSGKMA